MNTRPLVCARTLTHTHTHTHTVDYGITAKSVRDIWNMRTWGWATIPYWTEDDKRRYPAHVRERECARVFVCVFTYIHTYTYTHKHNVPNRHRYVDSRLCAACHTNTCTYTFPKHTHAYMYACLPQKTGSWTRGCAQRADGAGC